MSLDKGGKCGKFSDHLRAGSNEWRVSDRCAICGTEIIPFINYVLSLQHDSYGTGIILKNSNICQYLQNFHLDF